MFENIRAGWRLGGATRKLIMQDKQLFLYPLIAFFISIVLAILLVASFIFIGTSSALDIAMLIIYYILVYFISTYVIIAMLIAFRSHGKKKHISIGEAFSQTKQYWKLALEWAVFDAIITLIIRLIEGRGRSGSAISGFAGRAIIGSIVGIAFATASMFAIPVIIDNKVGPIDAIKTSAKFIFKNFGKTFGGFAYADVYSILIILAGIALIIGGVVLATSVLALGVIIGVLGFGVFVFGILFSYVIGNVLRLIIYDYMNDSSNLPDGLDKNMIEGAMKTNVQRQGNI